MKLPFIGLLQRNKNSRFAASFRHMASVENHKYTNKLINEKSPYLLQHAHNPVNWYPWNKEALDTAKELNRLIFLSIGIAAYIMVSDLLGYSTCHWCHVMEGESFENEETAKIMNEHYISIKVDREERPDIDKQYMTFVTATTASGGWPLSVFLTPDLLPIFGGTYFPPKERQGMGISFPSLLTMIAKRWSSSSDEIIKNSQSVHQTLKNAIQSDIDSTIPESIHDQVLSLALKLFKTLSKAYDPKYGGFGNAPKFPTPVNLEFLLSFYDFQKRGLKDFRWDLDYDVLKTLKMRIKSRTGLDIEADSKEELVQELQKAKYEIRQALNMVSFTLTKLAKSGIYDHIGGGFHRYSVDQCFRVPHFEKMLYDQAQLLTIYIEFGNLMESRKFSDVAVSIVDYVENNLRDKKSGAFFSGEDADSFPTEESQKKKEGAFYVWEESEIKSALSEREALIFCYHYGVHEKGNVDPNHDPHMEFTNKNILFEKYPITETAAQFDNYIEKTESSPSFKSLDETREILGKCVRKLNAVRNSRPKPHLDDKIITSLMISALCKAYALDRGYLGLTSRRNREDYIKLASDAANFIIKEMTVKEDSNVFLLKSYRNGPSNIMGFDTDYTNFIQALIDLYQVTSDDHWLNWALQLQTTFDTYFWDDKNGGYLQCAKNIDAPKLWIPMKDNQDGAEPAAHSTALGNLLKLHVITGNSSFRSKAVDLFARSLHLLTQAPNSMPLLISNALLLTDEADMIILLGKKSDRNFEIFYPILMECFRSASIFVPIVLSDNSNASPLINPPFLNEKIEEYKKSGESAVYVCSGESCASPITYSEELKYILGRECSL